VSDLISRGTRNAFREYFVGTTLHEIEMAFEVADLTPDRNFSPQVSGSRRSFVEQYYHCISWTDARQVRKVLSVYERVLGILDPSRCGNASDAQAAERVRAPLLSALERDGYTFSAGRIRSVQSQTHLIEAAAAFAHLDAPELKAQIERMRDAIENDPSLAVGTSKELVESACRTILEENSRTIDAGWDLVRLAKEARDELDLLPEDVPEQAKGNEAIKKLLANLGVVVQSLAEVRNLYGTGHGRNGARQALKPRHARLAVGAATTLATFLLETHWEKRQ